MIGHLRLRVAGSMVIFSLLLVSTCLKAVNAPAGADEIILNIVALSLAVVLLVIPYRATIPAIAVDDVSSFTFFKKFVVVNPFWKAAQKSVIIFCLFQPRPWILSHIFTGSKPEYINPSNTFSSASERTVVANSSK
ncbi:hypothetical protein [Ramu stunt virus]|uniref:Uncharacterized protein n=1 Tax=Ramu stunt virus TaxID=1738604 RepID=A0A0P0IAM1_9VIRU|nr:hypothetical protein [Ramu stunt virus]